MTVKADGKAEAPKTLDDLFARDQASLDEAASGGEEEFTFEGGELDGQKLKASELDAITSGKPASEGENAEADASKKEGEAEAAPEVKDAAEAKPEGETAPAADGEVTKPTEGDEAPKTGTETQGEQPKFEPNFGYKVYDQEKSFPDWAKPLVTSKETEESMRTVFSKSDAFDVLKPKHEVVVRERDENRSLVQEHVEKVQRLVSLRDANPAAFLDKMGLKEDAIVDLAVQIVEAKKDPQKWAVFQSQKETASRELENAAAQAREAQTRASDFEQIHRTNMDHTMSLPQVVDVKARIEKAYGPTGFDTALNSVLVEMRGQGRQGYIHPMEAMQKVVERYAALPPVQQSSSSAAPATPAPQTQAPVRAQQSNGAPARSQTPTRSQTLPTVGKGGGVASPTSNRPKTLDAVKAKVEAELAAMGEG